MNETDIQQLIFHWKCNSNNIIIPNVFIYEWEMDVAIITNAKLVYEYEIKTSKVDFKNDFNKKRKHSSLAGKSIEQYSITFKIPNFFYYCCPADLIKLEEIPDYAGLIYFINGGIDRLIKKAPKLTDDRLSNDRFDRIARNFYFRFWQLRNTRYQCNECLFK